MGHPTYSGGGAQGRPSLLLCEPVYTHAQPLLANGGQQSPFSFFKNVFLHPFSFSLSKGQRSLTQPNIRLDKGAFCLVSEDLYRHPELQAVPANPGHSVTEEADCYRGLKAQGMLGAITYASHWPKMLRE